MSGVSNPLFGRIQMQHLNLSNLMQWGDHLSVEHPAIDAQHKAIFDLGNEVYEKWRGGGSVDVLRPSVDKLANLVQGHFAYEERLLAEIGYEELKEHSLEHRSMLDELQIVHERFHTIKEGLQTRGASVLAPGWSVMQFILGFTIGHVMSGDMSYVKALSAYGNRAQTTP